MKRTKNASFLSMLPVMLRRYLWYAISGVVMVALIATTVAIRGEQTFAAVCSGAYTWTERTSAGSHNWGDITSSGDGTKLAAGVSNGYNYTSTDSGATWTQRSGPDGQFFTAAISSSLDGSRLTSGPSEGYPYVSSNSGVNWSYGHQIGLKWRDFASADDGQVIVAGTMTYLYTSTNAGGTFTSRTGPGQRWWAGVDTSADGTKQVAAARTNATGGTGRLYRSSDSGVTWAQLSNAGLRDYSDIASSLDGTKLVATAYGGYVYTSTDSGATWTERTLAGSRNWENVAASGDGTIIAATVDIGNIYVSADSGVTWTALTDAGSRDWEGITMSTDGTKMAAIVYGGYIYTGACPTNSAPSAPTVTAPSTGYTNVSDTFQFSNSVDPEGNTIRYVVDWNNNGTVDEYAPASGYIASGASTSTSYAWSTDGVKDYQVAAEDSNGARSSWMPGTITITGSPVVLLTASTTSFRQGDSPVGLEWSSSDATSCTGTNFLTGGATNGATSVTPSATTTYSISCTGPGGSGNDDVTINYIANQAPASPDITGPTVGRTGVTYQYTVTASDPDVDPVTIGIDCNADGVVDSWAP